MFKRVMWSLLVFVPCLIPVAYASSVDAPVTASVVITNGPATRSLNAGVTTPQSKEVVLMPVHLTPKQRQILRNDISAPHKFSRNRSVRSNNLPARAAIGMNNVPVLNQGRHGSCVTFAVTAALDAMLNKGDYISQLCSLELGDYLSQRGYSPSGWDGSNGSTVVHQIEQFGIVSKSDQQAKTCGGVKAYPLMDMTNTGKPVSLDEYKSMSQGLTDMDAGKMFYWEPMLTVSQRFQWDNAGNGADKMLNDIKEWLTTPMDDDQAKVNSRLITSLMLPVKHCSAGACGQYHAVNDTWALSDEIINDPDPELGGHEMIITGYDDNAVVVDKAGTKHQGVLTLRNSWGSDVADHGEYYMTYDFYKHFVMDAHKLMMITFTQPQA